MKEYIKECIDINCDVGESYGNFIIGQDKELMPFLSSCNIACGLHGGDPTTMRKTIELATSYDIKIGAHPSFPDRMGFGRWSMKIPENELFDLICYQIAVVKGMCEAYGATLHHVKLHGALYNQLYEQDGLVRRALANAVLRMLPEGIVYGPPSVELLSFFQGNGITYWPEGFIDRAYDSDGHLLPRAVGEAAMLHDPNKAAEQAVRFVLQKEVVCNVGTVIPMSARTLCIHSDTKNALDIMKQVQEQFEQHAIITGDKVD